MENFTYEMDERSLRELVRDHIAKLFNIEVNTTDIQIEVKSAKNYRANEWEAANFRARLTKTVTTRS